MKYINENIEVSMAKKVSKKISKRATPEVQYQRKT